MRQAQLTNLAKKSDSLVAFLWLFFLFTISSVLLVYIYIREFPQNRYTVLSILIFPLKKIPLTSLVYLNFH